jgi:hypothetical protein
LRAFATAWCAKKNECVVSDHGEIGLYCTSARMGKQNPTQLFLRCERIDIHPPPAAIEPHVAVQ